MPVSAGTALCLSCLLGFCSFTAAVGSPATANFSFSLLPRQVGEAAQQPQPRPGHLLHPGKVNVSEMVW